MNTEENSFRKKDQKGNYDVDGVSYDGKAVYVSGDKTESQDESESKIAAQEVPGKDVGPVELDRKKNLDSEGKAAEA